MHHRVSVLLTVFLFVAGHAPCSVVLAAQKPAKKGAPGATAAPPAATDGPAKLAALNAEAVAGFKAYSFAKARRAVDQALVVAEEQHLTRAAEHADTLVLLAVFSVSGKNDVYRGLHYFAQALRVNDKSKIPDELTTPQLQTLFSQAKESVKRVGTPKHIELAEPAADDDDNAGQTVKVATGRGLLHTPIDSAKPGYPIPVRVQPGVDIQAHRVFLYYRTAGKVTYEQVPMQPTREYYRAQIPASATGTRFIHYYIEALDKRGSLAGSKGSPRSPNVILIQN